MKALMHVGAAGGFADGMQIQAAQVRLKVVHGDEMSVAFAQPLGQAGPACFQLNQHQYF